MKTALKESIWLAAIIIVSVLTFHLYLGNSAADIGMHDTYIDVNSSDGRQSPVVPAILVFIISLAFLVYMVRGLINRFKYIPANLILILVAGIDIFYFSSNRIVYVTPPTSGSMGIITGGASGSLMPYQLLSVFFYPYPCRDSLYDRKKLEAGTISDIKIKNLSPFTFILSP